MTCSVISRLMRRSYRFILICLVLISILKGWSTIVPTSVELASQKAVPSPKHSQAAETARRDLLESLQRLVAHENYYRSVYGKFTPYLGRVGYSIPSKVAESYEIRVVEATEAKLLISAFEESDPKSFEQGDLVSIDQFYHLEANFSVPLPRVEFLKAQATKHLRLVRDAQPGRSVSEEGIYKDYFHYEIREDSKGKKVAVAIGMQPPVLGVELDSESGSEDSMNIGLTEAMPDEVMGESNLNLEESVPDSSVRKAEGANVAGAGATMSSSEEEYLAQQIFHGEVGRYARNWAELTKIANFNFDDKILSSDADLDRTAGANVDRQVAGGAKAQNSESRQLEIEPISE